jgi:hypothetical protein
MRRNKFFSLPITALILLLGMFQDLAFAAGPHTIEKDGWQNGIPTWHWPMETKLCAKVEGAGKMVGGLSVIEPRIKTDNMKAVLAVFQGRARLVDAPEQIFEVATTTVAPATTIATTVAPTPPSTLVGETVPATTKAPRTTTTTSTTSTTLVPVYVESNSVGILPTNDPACR